MYKESLTLIVLLILMAVFASGCGALYGNEAQYREGDWYWFSSSGEVARIHQDKLAMKKLKKQNPIAKSSGPNMGYKVILANFSDYNRYTFRLNGPERVAYMLSPGEQINVYLIPGVYQCRLVHDGKVSEARKMRVDSQKKRFQNKECHGFVYTE